MRGARGQHTLQPRAPSRADRRVGPPKAAALETGSTAQAARGDAARDERRQRTVRASQPESSF